MAASSCARENLSSRSRISDMEPFAHGVFRNVAMHTYINGPREGQKGVVKWFRTGHVYENDFYQHDIKAVEKAIELVDEFNKAKIIDKSILVSRANVWEGIKGDIINKKFLVEPFIDNWQKWNSNNGWQQEGRGQAENSWNAIMQALSHFTFHVSGGVLLLCDLQGGLLQNGAVLSDPVIMSRTREFGVTDLGVDGISNFFFSHKCTDFCRKSWVQFPNPKPLFARVKATTLEALHAPTMEGRAQLTFTGMPPLESVTPPPVPVPASSEMPLPPSRVKVENSPRARAVPARTPSVQPASAQRDSADKSTDGSSGGSTEGFVNVKAEQSQ